MKLRRILLSLLSLSWVLPVQAADDDAALAFFESKIRPVLAENCYECHSAKAGSSKGGLQLDTRESLRAGGDSGPAVVPGKPAESLLLSAVAHADPELKMPPKKPQLPAHVIADFKTWIEMGAPDPREKAVADAAQPPVTLEAGRAFWSYRKPEDHPLPAVSDQSWARRDLDTFILAALDAQKMQPSADAPPAVLLRRLHFDLVGLPPSPEALESFLARAMAEGLDAALAQEVDALLASPHFGERWGRHWLDVARYGESNGRESNLTFPHAWRFRDYVIQALNADKPFNRFITEQIAGDLLPARDDADRANLLVATGFLAFGPKGLNEMNAEQFAADVVDEQIDTVTRAVIASSVACARCHDHKFDPFHMQDYYALAGIFQSTTTAFGASINSENSHDSPLITLPRLPGEVIVHPSVPKAKVDEIKAQIAKLNEEERKGMASIAAAMAQGKALPETYTLADALRILWGRGGLQGQLKLYDDNGNALPLCMGVGERSGSPVNAPLLERGEIAKPGPVVPRGFPRVMPIATAGAPGKDGSGRLELAAWLTSPEHPLTARVMANRVWRHLLGEGIVASVDNFGFTGDRPSHPELLDHLAVSFVQNGWSVKKLVREIALSRTYRQASDWREDYFLQDPENRMLWRANKRRLDAECIRDAMLAAAGTLDPAPRRGSLIAEVGDGTVSMFGFNKNIPSDLDGSRKRSVYLPTVRDRMPDVLDLFDAAEASLVTGDRETTNVPMQALYLMNSPFVMEQAAALADRLEKETNSTEGWVRRAFQLTCGRFPEKEEMDLAIAFLRQEGDPKAVMASYCQALLATAEFRNVD